MFCISHHHCAVLENWPLFFFSFFGFHILLLYLKIDENPVSEFLIKTLASVTWAFWLCLSLGPLAGFFAPWHLQSQLLAPGSGALPFFPPPRGCKLQDPQGPCRSYKWWSWPGRGSHAALHAPSERSMVLTSFSQTDWLFPSSQTSRFLWELA